MSERVRKRQKERGRVDVDGWAVQMERDMRRAKVQHRAQTIIAAPVWSNTDGSLHSLKEPGKNKGPLPEWRSIHFHYGPRSVF